MTKPRIGLVLSGGGARGAYEAGVIRYMREELPASSRDQVRFDLICGVSVGAVTACHLAATMDSAPEQGRLLESLWTDLSLERVYRVEGQDLWSIARGIWRITTNEPVRAEGWRFV
jgi:NTE family protein